MAIDWQLAGQAGGNLYNGEALAAQGMLSNNPYTTALAAYQQAQQNKLNQVKAMTQAQATQGDLAYKNALMQQIAYNMDPNSPQNVLRMAKANVAQYGKGGTTVYGTDGQPIVTLGGTPGVNGQIPGAPPTSANIYGQPIAGGTPGVPISNAANPGMAPNVPMAQPIAAGPNGQTLAYAAPGTNVAGMTGNIPVNAYGQRVPTLTPQAAADLQKKENAEMAKASEDATQANQSINDLRELGDLNQKLYYTGPGGGIARLGEKYASFVSGGASDAYSVTQAFESKAKNAALILKSYMPGSMSDADREFLIGMAPSLNKTREANQFLIDSSIAANTFLVQHAQFKQDYRRLNGTLQGSETAWNQYLNAHRIVGKDSKGNLKANIPTQQDYDEFVRNGFQAQTPQQQAATTGAVTKVLSGISPDQYNFYVRKYGKAQADAFLAKKAQGLVKEAPTKQQSQGTLTRPSMATDRPIDRPTY
jgi:hypothetical protein